MTVTNDLCRCGCGLKAPLVQRTNTRRGHVKGQRLSYRPGHNRRGSTDLTRFVVRDDGCWEWTGSRDRKGYGRVQIGRRHTGAHRAIYEAHRGPIPAGLDLDHLCRRASCVNPGHLEPVTPAENRRRQTAAFDRMIEVAA